MSVPGHSRRSSYGSNTSGLPRIADNLSAVGMCAPKVASWAHQRYPTENRCEADGWLWETHDAHFPEGTQVAAVASAQSGVNSGPSARIHCDRMTHAVLNDSGESPVPVFLRATKVAEGRARESAVISGPLAACCLRRALPDTAMNFSATPGTRHHRRPRQHPTFVPRYGRDGVLRRNTEGEITIDNTPLS
jgi:hypothetical protein